MRSRLALQALHTTWSLHHSSWNSLQEDVVAERTYCDQCCPRWMIRFVLLAAWVSDWCSNFVLENPWALSSGTRRKNEKVKILSMGKICLYIKYYSHLACPLSSYETQILSLLTNIFSWLTFLQLFMHSIEREAKMDTKNLTEGVHQDIHLVTSIYSERIPTDKNPNSSFLV